MEGKIKWNEMIDSNKIMLIIRIIVSICVVALASLQLFGVWDKAINVAAPLMGVVLVIQAIQNWRQRRSVAVFELCASIFIFGCAIIVWFG